MNPSFLLGVAASLNVATVPEGINLNQFPVDLAPVPFVTDVKITDNNVSEFLIND